MTESLAVDEGTHSVDRATARTAWLLQVAAFPRHDVSRDEVVGALKAGRRGR